MNAMFTLERVTQPDIEPLTLAEARQHIRGFASDTSENDYLEALITAAREWVEDYTGRALIDQAWRLTVSQGGILSGDIVGGFTGGTYYGAYQPSLLGGILLRKSPALAITSVKTVATDGTETAIDAATYQLREAASKWPRVVPLSGASWNIAQALRIEFRAGFADRLGSPQQGAELVPSVIKQAMKLIISNFYDNREPVNVGNSVNKMPLNIEWLVASQKCELGMG